MAIKIAGTEVINDNKELVLAKLTEIDASIADTAVDIFVYDTRKDSDCGAWRKRTQHTSWYNETLNTATRGSRKEFPAVAVIVTSGGGSSGNAVTIYDGDDPDLPMWMVFNQTVYGHCSPYVGSVEMKNGLMIVGTTAGGNGYSFDNFIEDAGGVRDASSHKYWINKAIADRDVTASGYGQVIDTQLLVNGFINDVAMTVLPNAPIDAATGLPVPTIAVATDGGVSVIKDDGTVVDAPQSAYDGPISIGEDGVFFVGRSTASTNVIYGFELSSLDTSSSDYFYASTSVPYLGSAISGGFVKDVVRTGADSFSYGYNTHFGNIAEQRQDITKGMVNVVTSSYNTGWMNGDIKLATLSDTDDTDVTGSELVTNGTFDTDTSGWTDADSCMSYDSTNQRMQLDGSGSNKRVYQYLTGLTVGKRYVLSLTATGSANGYISTTTNSSGSLGGLGYSSAYSDTPLSLSFTATQTNLYLVLYVITTTAYFDNVSVRLAEEDRSVNGNGLQVFGTVTKNPVSSGADLVAYSGFSTSNYLEQPYNSDLDFGTGDFCYMAWFNYTAYGSSQYLYERGNSSLRDFLIYISGDLIRFWSANDVVSATVSASTWNNIVVTRRSGTVYIYINGEEITSTGFTVDLSSLTSPSVRIGVGNVSLGGPAINTKIALTRISATAPSPEQIKKIYEDEKVLFQENAQATLYGDSDAVTALAYDDSTELLHVGTSEGRSVFQGLRRVDNTTTAVGAAISASGGLVADE